MSNYGALIQERYVRKLRENFAERQKQIAALKTADDAWAFIARAKKRLAEAWVLPTEQIPFNLRETGVVDAGSYVIRKIIYDGLKDCPVSALLYVPKNLQGQAPAVLLLAGHSDNGKARDYHQTIAASLCRKGYVVLSPDPIGQGERFQYPDIKGLCSAAEHAVHNRRLLLVGDNMGTLRLIDARRSLDVLCSLPYVDTKRIGVTGASGGGTMTSLLNAVDGRLACAAPACYITRWYRNLESERPVDGEQMPPGAARDGGEMADLLLAAAPRPLLILGQLDDIFDVRGTREVYEEVKHIYTLLGCPERVQYAEGPTIHSYSIELRRQAYAFMNRCLGVDADDEEPSDLRMFADEELWCTPTGRTIELPNTKSVHGIICEKARALAAARPQRTAAELKGILDKALGIGNVDVPYHRHLRPNVDREHRRAFARYALETEAGLVTTLIHANGPNEYLMPADCTELLVPDHDAYEELKTLPQPLAKSVYAIDYRGIGESLPNGCDPASPSYISYLNFDYCYAAYSLLLNESYLGGRVRDVIGAIKLLHACGNPDVTLTANGKGSVVAILAAFLCDEPVRLELKTPVPTFLQAALSPLGDLPQSMVIPGILSLTDLDEIVHMIG